MKVLTSTIVLVASVTLTAATTPGAPVYNSTTGKFDCPVANGVYCAGDSLKTNIIIRCTDGVGVAGNCVSNLYGEPPLGLFPALCWSSPTDIAVAACAKNCIVYGSSGNCPGNFQLPDCVPIPPSDQSTTPSPTHSYTIPPPYYPTNSTTRIPHHSSTTAPPHESTPCTTTPTPDHTTTHAPPPESSECSTATITDTVDHTKVKTHTVTVTTCPLISATVPYIPTGGGGCHGKHCGGNGTNPTQTTTPSNGLPGSTGPVPVGPSAQPTFNSGNVNTAGISVAAIGLVLAYLV